MVQKYGVFLRGINVNGVKMKMDDLKKAFAAMTYGGARTVLATGNVIITSGDDPSALKTSIEAGLSGWFKYDANVFLRSAPELRYVLAASKSAGAPEGFHLYYILCDNSRTINELAGIFHGLEQKEREAFIPIETGAFWIVPVGETLDSAFGTKVLGDRKYKNQLTSRNMNTVEKIVHAMGEG